MVVFDACFLSILLHPSPRIPDDPKTKKPVERAKAKIENLITTLETDHEKCILPTPALSEVLALVPAKAPEYLAELTNTYSFEVAAFDEMAAVEAAIMAAAAKAAGGKKGGSDSTWAKVKFDRQIVAIAKVRGAKTVYTNDGDVRKAAEREGMKVVSVWELPNPPAEQPELFDDTV